MTRKTIYLFIVLILIGWGIVMSNSKQKPAEERPIKTFSGNIEVLHTPECSPDLELIDGLWTVDHSKALMGTGGQVAQDAPKIDCTGLQLSGIIHNKSNHEIKKVMIRFIATGPDIAVPWEDESSIRFKSDNPSTPIDERQKINKNEQKPFKTGALYQETKHVIFDSVKIKLIEGL